MYAATRPGGRISTSIYRFFFRTRKIQKKYQYIYQCTYQNIEFTCAEMFLKAKTKSNNKTIADLSGLYNYSKYAYRITANFMVI